MFRAIRNRTRSFTPSNEDMDQLLAKLDKLLRELDAQIAVQKNFPHEQQVKDRKKEIDGLKVDISLSGADPTGKIPMKDGKVDKEKLDEAKKEIEALKELMKGKDAAKIKKKFEEINEKIQKLSIELYEKAKQQKPAAD